MQPDASLGLQDATRPPDPDLYTYRFQEAQDSGSMCCRSTMDVG